MKVYFETLGCKVNQYETEEMLERFLQSGYLPAHTAKEADVLVVNSCTVTSESVRKVRQTVRHLKKQQPNAVLILTGCASQAEPEMVADLPEVDILMGNRTNAKITEVLSEYLGNKHFLNAREEHRTGDAFTGAGITTFEGHTRAFLKIQDGCDRFCSYCLIPTARGRSRSKPLSQIDRELAALEKSGYREIVFVGINLSDYGKGTAYSLPDALLLAEKYPGIRRVRLGSLEPDHITPEMIQRFRALPKLCAQFHISVQSGCNKVLRAMNRHYTSEEYEELVKALRAAFPDAAITTDILVGFPTETEEDFRVTEEFAVRIGFEKVHVFPYSKRNATPAAKLPQLTNAVKADRAGRLISTTEALRAAYLERQVGKITEVLFEADRDGFSEGYTENYTPVKILDSKKRQGSLCTVRLIGAEKDCCIGEEIG